MLLSMPRSRRQPHLRAVRPRYAIRKSRCRGTALECDVVPRPIHSHDQPIDEMPAAAVRVPTFNLAFLPRFAAMSEEDLRAFAKSKPLRKEFMLTMGREGFPQREMRLRNAAVAPDV